MARPLDVGRLADRLDDLVEVVERDLEAFQDVSPCPSLLQVELGPATDDLASMIDVVPQDGLERQRLGLAIDEGEHVHVEGGLHRRVFEQVVEDAVWVGVALDLDVDAHAVAVGLVAQVGDAVDLLRAHQFGDLLEQGGLVDHVRQLSNDDRHAAEAGFLERDLSAHHDASPAVGVHLADGVDGLVLAGDGVAASLVAVHRAAGREVGAGDVLAEVVRSQLWVLDQGACGIADFAQVVGRDVGRHADGDSGRAVDEQVGEPGRQDSRLFLGAVVVVHEVDRVLVYVGQHLGRDAGQAGFRVAHGGSAVSVDRAEVALAVDERVAHREVLGKAD